MEVTIFDKNSYRHDILYCFKTNVNSDYKFIIENTPGTAGGPGGRDRTLAVESRKTSEKSPFFLKKIKFIQKKYFFLHIKKYFFLHISSSYAKILGEKLFRTWEIPRSRSKAEDGEKKKRKKRANDGARKHAWRLGHFRL